MSGASQGFINGDVGAIIAGALLFAICGILLWAVRMANKDGDDSSNPSNSIW